MTRTIQRRGCTVNLPDRPKISETEKHRELAEARANDLFRLESAELLAVVLKLDLPGLRVGGERT